MASVKSLALVVEDCVKSVPDRKDVMPGVLASLERGIKQETPKRSGHGWHKLDVRSTNRKSMEQTHLRAGGWLHRTDAVFA